TWPVTTTSLVSGRLAQVRLTVQSSILVEAPAARLNEAGGRQPKPVSTGSTIMTLARSKSPILETRTLKVTAWGCPLSDNCTTWLFGSPSKSSGEVTDLLHTTAMSFTTAMAWSVLVTV